MKVKQFLSLFICLLTFLFIFAEISEANNDVKYYFKSPPNIYPSYNKKITEDKVISIEWSWNNSIKQTYQIYSLSKNKWSKPKTIPINAYNLVNNNFYSIEEIYDWKTDTWKQPKYEIQIPNGSNSIKLKNGNILVAGGFDSNMNPINTVRIYDPQNNNWFNAETMNIKKKWPFLFLLISGNVLALDEEFNAEIYDTNNNTWKKVSDGLGYLKNINKVIQIGEDSFSLFNNTLGLPGSNQSVMFKDINNEIQILKTTPFNNRKIQVDFNYYNSLDYNLNKSEYSSTTWTFDVFTKLSDGRIILHGGNFFPDPNNKPGAEGHSEFVLFYPYSETFNLFPHTKMLMQDIEGTLIELGPNKIMIISSSTGSYKKDNKRSDSILGNYSIVFTLPDVGTRIKVNGQYLSGSSVIVEGGRILVPLRGVLDKLGATISWDSSTNKVHIMLDNNEIVMTIGNRFMLYNNSIIELEQPSKVIQGKTYIPLRAIAETLGLTINWDSNNGAVILTSGK